MSQRRRSTSPKRRDSSRSRRSHKRHHRDDSPSITDFESDQRSSRRQIAFSEPSSRTSPVTVPPMFASRSSNAVNDMQFTSTVAQQPRPTLPQSTPSPLPQHALAQLNVLEFMNMIANVMQPASNSTSAPSSPK